MKRLFIVICSIIIPWSFSYGQENKIFDCGLFSFEYPSTYKTSPIQNAPHMVLKLESDKYFFSASYWDKGLSEDMSIWDDEIFNLYKENAIGNGDLIDITRETIQTKSGPRRCLKLKTNIYKRKQGVDIYIKVLSYLMLHKGYLFTFAFTSQGKYTQNTQTTYPDKIMKGLKFKTTDTINEDFDGYLIEIVKKLNEQCPMQIDDCTTHLHVLLSGKTVIMKTLVEDFCDDLVNYDEFKKKMCQNLSVALEKPFVQYLDSNGYSVIYMIYNENDRLKKKISITGRDILNYYQ